MPPQNTTHGPDTLAQVSRTSKITQRSQPASFRFAAMLVGALVFPVAAPAAEALPIGLLVMPKTKYSVAVVPQGYAPEKALISALAGLPVTAPMPGDVHQANKQYANALNHHENALPPLSARFEAAAVKALPRVDERLAPVVLPPDLVEWGKSVYSNIDPEKTRYFIQLFPAAGYASAPGRQGTVAPFVAGRFEFHDARNRKRLLKGKATRHGPDNTDNVLYAVETPTDLIEQFDSLVTGVIRDVHAQLTRSDILHRVAAGTSFAGAYPSIKATLGHHAKRFELQRPDSKVLFYKRSDDPYEHTAVPSRFKQRFGLVTRVDVLAAELGQAFESLDDFVKLALERRADGGWSVSELRENTTFDASDAWTSYVLPNPTGGESVFFHRKVKDFVLTHRVDLKDDDERRRAETVKKFNKIVTRYIRLTKLKID